MSLEILEDCLHIVKLRNGRHFLQLCDLVMMKRNCPCAGMAKACCTFEHDGSGMYARAELAKLA